MDDIFVIYVMWMMCYICEICVVEAGNINKIRKSSLDSLPRARLSANIPLCRELGGRLSANLRSSSMY